MVRMKNGKEKIKAVSARPVTIYNNYKSKGKLKQKKINRKIYFKQNYGFFVFYKGKKRAVQPQVDHKKRTNEKKVDTPTNSFDAGIMLNKKGVRK